MTCQQEQVEGENLVQAGKMKKEWKDGAGHKIYIL
jgi:hypothetical protein